MRRLAIGRRALQGSTPRRTAAWVTLATTLGLVALLGYGVDARGLDWQPGLALQQPWRAFSAVGVHYSALHLAANLAGLLLTAAFGIAADVPPRAAAAWFVAWPMTQAALALTPELTRFGGLSGVLHAGVVVVAAWLVVRGAGARRWIGGAVALGCAAKVAGETPWAEPLLRHPPGWDIATAPIAHLTGCAAGVVFGLAAACWPGPAGPRKTIRG